MLLGRACENCLNYQALFLTVAAVDFKRGIPLKDPENRRIFTESIEPILKERKCKMRFEFETGKTKPTAILPSRGWCEEWMDLGGNKDK